jgi:hypothetical protein
MVGLGGGLPRGFHVLQSQKNLSMRQCMSGRMRIRALPMRSMSPRFSKATTVLRCKLLNYKAFIFRGTQHFNGSNINLKVR